jgi:hypothetical protein
MFSLEEQQRRQAWQRGGGVKLDSAMAAFGLVATNAVLPPRTARVVMKTPAAIAMAGAQTINTQLKARKRQR